VRSIHQLDSKLDPAIIVTWKTARQKSWHLNAKKIPSQTIHLNNPLDIPQEENPRWRSILKQFFQDQFFVPLTADASPLHGSQSTNCTVGGIERWIVPLAICDQI
jgi:hypothetical protein